MDALVFTIREMLNLPVFEGSELAAGTTGIDREVKTITVAEVPDAADWLKGGEVVLSTAYYMQGDALTQRSWLESMIRGGAVALAIKVDRFLGTVPEEMCRIADENSFPLIVLPPNITWPALIEGTMNAVSNFQSAIIRKAERIHNELTRIVLNGDGLGVIADTISGLVGGIIVVEDSELNCIAHTGAKGFGKEIADLLEYRLSDAFLESFRNSKVYADVRRFHRAKSQHFVYADARMRQLTNTVVAGDTFFGFVTMIVQDQRPTDVDRVALEHGATTIALELMQDKIRYETKMRLRRDFMEDVLAGKLTQDNSYLQRFRFLKFSEQNHVVAIAIHLSDHRGASADSSVKMFNYRVSNQVTRVMESFFAKSKRESFLYSEDNKVRILLSCPAGQRKEEIFADVRALLERMFTGLTRTMAGLSYQVGVGNICSSLGDIQKGYAQAMDALNISEKFMGWNNICFFNEMGVYRFLYMIDKKEELVEFCTDQLGPLLDRTDRERGKEEDLIATLEAYLQNNGNLSKAAEELFIHVNTLTYRLKKISALLGRDLNEANVRYSLYLAIMIRRIYYV